MKKVNLYYWGLVFSLGMSIGYYLLPYFFRPSEKATMEVGFMLGVKTYKDYITRMGTFESISDSCTFIYIGGDTITVYK